MVYWRAGAQRGPELALGAQHSELRRRFVRHVLVLAGMGRGDPVTANASGGSRLESAVTIAGVGRVAVAQEKPKPLYDGLGGVYSIATNRHSRR